MTALVLAAAFGAVFALWAGIASMMLDRPVSGQRSAAWMGWRVAAQAAALLFVLLALATAAFV